jgi:hypothetical protein
MSNSRHSGHKRTFGKEAKGSRAPGSAEVWNLAQKAYIWE